MLMKLLGEKKQENRRSALRVPMNLSLCFQVLHNYNDPAVPLRYGNCFISRTVDVSSGGMCILHKGMLFPKEYVLIRPRTTLLDPCTGTCAGCYRREGLADMQLTEPVVAQVRWKEGAKCGLHFVSWHADDRHVIHKASWNEHLSQARRDADFREQMILNRMDNGK